MHKILFPHLTKDYVNPQMDPTVALRSEILQFLSLFKELERINPEISLEKRNIDHYMTQIKNIETSIENDKEKLKKEKNPNKIRSLHSGITKLIKHRKKLLKKDSKAMLKKYHNNLEQTRKKYEDTVKLLYFMNIQPLTLIHRINKDINVLIKKVKALKHNEKEGLELLKENSIRILNSAKIKLKKLSDELYRVSEYHDRKGFNPAEAVKEFSLQSTTVKIRRIRQKSIEIAKIENRVKEQRKDMNVNQLPSFVEHNIELQIHDIEYISHHIKLITHRTMKLIHNYIDNEHIKLLYKKKMRRLVKQSRYLWNSIKIKEYRAKIKNRSEVLQN